MRNLLFTLWLVGTLTASAVPPAISNVTAEQRAGTKFVDIHYTVVDPDSGSLTLQLEISANSGQTYDLPVKSLTGSIGPNVTPGANKLITWNAGADWNGNWSPSCKVRLWAHDGSTPVPPLGMVYVPPGTFRMGWESSTVIGGDVTLTHGYFMDRYEVSGALWTVVRNWALLHGYAFGTGGFRASDHPAQSMTWNDAAIWCNARSQMEGLTPCYYMENTKANVWKAGNIQPLPSFVNWTANGYRLPTEAEWERAARGGLDRKVYPWGDTIANHQANYSESGDPFETSGGGAAADAGTTPIGYYNGSQVPAGQNMANGFGLYDMAGNVWEFCWDWYSTSAPSGQTDPTGPMSGSYRSLKGGSWGDSNSISLSCAFKANWETQIVSRSVSFRCVRSL